MVEQTTGEALQRVKGATPGNIMEAYRRVHQFHARQTLMILLELRPQVMIPTVARHDNEVARRIGE